MPPHPARKTCCDEGSTPGGAGGPRDPGLDERGGEGGVMEYIHNNMHRAPQCINDHSVVVANYNNS